MKLDILGVEAVRLVPENDADRAILQHFDDKYLHIAICSEPVETPVGKSELHVTYEVTQAMGELQSIDNIQELNNLKE